MSKSLKEKAITIKGKKYVLVSDRVIYFNETFKDGSIETELLSQPQDDRIVIKAIASPDGKRKFVGHSQAVVGDGYINKTSALENAETSAIGRALAMMGIGVLDSIASYDEMNKAGAISSVSSQDPKGMVCNLCGEDAKISARTGKLYCAYWQAHKKDGKNGAIIPKEKFEKNKEFFEGIE